MKGVSWNFQERPDMISASTGDIYRLFKIWIRDIFSIFDKSWLDGFMLLKLDMAKVCASGMLLIQYHLLRDLYHGHHRQWRHNGELRWRHNGHNSVSNHQPHHRLLNRLFRRRSKKTSKLRVTGLCVGNSPGTGEFPAQMASNAENVSIWWRHHVIGHHSVYSSHKLYAYVVMNLYNYYNWNWILYGMAYRYHVYSYMK